MLDDSISVEFSPQIKKKLIRLETEGKNETVGSIEGTV